MNLLPIVALLSAAFSNEESHLPKTARQRAPRCCSEPGCSKGARGKSGKCARHGGGKRCDVQGCTKLASSPTNQCSAHGGGYRCQEQECPKASIGKTGKCIQHGGGNRCAVQGCKNSTQCKSGKCGAHGGGNRCSEQGCANSVRGKTGKCSDHGGEHWCDEPDCPNVATKSTTKCKRHSGKRCDERGCNDKAIGNTSKCSYHGGGKRCNEQGCVALVIGKSDKCGRHGGGKRCDEQGCTKKADGATSKCVRHGGGKRCNEQDCKNSARDKTGKCGDHGGGKRCDEPSCNKFAQGKTGKCRRHGGGIRCNVQGCKKCAQGTTGKCIKHSKKLCDEQDCGHFARGKSSKCKRHEREKKRGKKRKYDDSNKQVVNNITINNNYFFSSTPVQTAEQATTFPVVSTERKTDGVSESCVLLGIATCSARGPAMIEFATKINNPGKYVRRNQLQSHQIIRNAEDLCFYTNVVNIPAATMPRKIIPSTFNFDAFILATKDCSECGLARSLNNTGRWFTTKKETRPYNYSDIGRARTKLHVFAPQGHVLNPSPENSYASETAQLTAYVRDQTDYGLVIVPGAATIDAIVFSKRTGDVTPVGFKNASNVRFESPTRMRFVYCHLKDHYFPEVLRCGKIGSVVIHSQQRKEDTKYVSMNRETLEISNLQEAYTFVAQDHNVLQHLVENHRFADFFDMDITPYITNNTCKLGALGEVLAQLFFGGVTSQTVTAGIADIFVNDRTVQIKVATGATAVTVHLEGSSGSSYATIDVFSYMIRVGQIMRVYLPMKNAEFTDILNCDQTSFGTGKIDPDGFPSASVKHFEHFVDVDLAKLLDLAESPDFDFERASPMIAELRAKLDLENIFGAHYSPYGDVHDVAKRITHKFLVDLLRWAVVPK